MKNNFSSLEKSYVHMVCYFLSAVTSVQVFAQVDSTNVNVNVDGNATDPGYLSGSPWLWILFVAVFIIVIVVLSRKRRD